MKKISSEKNSLDGGYGSKISIVSKRELRNDSVEETPKLQEPKNLDFMGFFRVSQSTKFIMEWRKRLFLRRRSFSIHNSIIIHHQMEKDAAFPQQRSFEHKVFLHSIFKIHKPIRKWAGALFFAERLRRQIMNYAL